MGQQPSNESKSRWLEKNKHRRPQINRDCRLRTFYGISPEEYETMLRQQDNKCAICKREFVEKPHIDHDHSSGWVRGLLCGPCNHAIGLFSEDVVRLQEAIEYLTSNVTPPEFNIFAARDRLKKKSRGNCSLRTQEQKDYLSKIRIGVPAWNKGKAWDENTKTKMSEAATQRISRETDEQKVVRLKSLDAGRKTRWGKVR